MADIFSRASDSFGGSFSADGVVVNFSNLGNDVGVGLLTQNLALNYSQNVSKVFEIGTDRVYFVAGRTNGSLGMGRILGPTKVQVALYNRFGDVCQAAKNNLTFTLSAACKPSSSAGSGRVFLDGPRAGSNTQTGQASNNRSIYETKFNVLIGIGLQMAAQDMIVNEQMQMMFGSLNVR